jgi:hypothetical protein
VPLQGDVLVRAVKEDTLDGGDEDEKCTKLAFDSGFAELLYVVEENYARLLSSQEKRLQSQQSEESVSAEPGPPLPKAETAIATVLVNGEAVPLDQLEERHFNQMSEKEYEVSVAAF